MGYPHLGPELAGTGVPACLGRDLGPVNGVPTKKDIGPVEVLWGGDGVPPRKNMGPVQVLWDTDGLPPSVVDKVKTLPLVVLRTRAVTKKSSSRA